VIIRLELRDADGWISSVDIGRLLGCGAGPAVSAMRTRLGFESTPENTDRNGRRFRYRLTDDQFGALLDLAEEVATVTAYGQSEGWTKTDIVDEDTGRPLRLCFLREKGSRRCVSAWQWRTDDGFASVEVGTMREALDQLLGVHPVGLRLSRMMSTT
jgi:hypothetical protein